MATPLRPGIVVEVINVLSLLFALKVSLSASNIIEVWLCKQKVC
jgi:hypothetical protein